MAVCGQMFLEGLSGTMEADTKRPGRDVEDVRGGLGGKAVPGDEPQGLALTLRQLRERAVDLRTGGVQVGGVASRHLALG
jgi:hypothetical protein